MQWQAFEQFLIAITVSVAIVLIGYLLEQVRPARVQSLKAARLNLLYLIPYVFAQTAITPLVASVVVIAVNALGGGLIILPTHGWPLLAGFLAYALAMDFSEFAFHRAQHAIPFLWALHSLHHSDREMNISTTNRHFWADQCIKSVTVYPVVGLLFRADPAIIAAYTMVMMYNYIPHMNVRIGLGRWSWLINSPQYHRLHHSARAEDYDKNFAGIFPIFDLLFGSYKQPRTGDYAPTGLDDGAHPSGLLEAIFWPWRGHRAARGASGSASPSANLSV